MFQTLKNALVDRLKEQGIAQAVQAAQVTEALKVEVAKRFGEATKGAFRKLAVRGDTVEVLVNSAALAGELRMAQFALEEALQGALSGKRYRLRIFG
jgi:hypothetical protein